MKNFKYKIYILASFLLFISCDDTEFLVEEPQTFYTSDNAFSSATQVDQVLITLYSDLRNFRVNNELIKGRGTDIMNVPEFRGIGFADYSQINSEDGSFNNIFNFHYKLIATANTALFAANLENIEWSSESEKAYAIAQAKFFRAYAHGILAELFGGIPIVTELINEPRYDYVRASRAESYQFAIDELEAILPDLPELTTQSGRLVKGVAQHYLSEFYLALGTETGDDANFQKSVDYASLVIDGGTYSLMTSRFGSRADVAGKNVWWDLFQMDNINYSDGNTESIWTFQIDFDAFLAGDNESFLNYPRNFMPVYRAIPGVIGTAEDVGGRGVAFDAPTPYTSDLIWEGSLEVGDERNTEYNIRRIIYYNDPAEPANFGNPVPQNVLDEANAGKGWIYPIFNKLTTDLFVGLDQGQDRSNLFRDEYAIRLPETILIRAEAYFRMSDNQKAADDINMIRDRVNATLIAAGDVDLDFILDERARELFIEESRWNTLLRMGGTVAVDRIRTYAKNDITRTTLTTDFNLWPIPQSVIDRNKDVKLEQNPGW
tara:strand:- start:252488 stop:254125 length:1638 start_codon:yes stop_codon:yes gene_type:complete